jgi:hypothetical protein
MTQIDRLDTPHIEKSLRGYFDCKYAYHSMAQGWSS